MRAVVAYILIAFGGLIIVLNWVCFVASRRREQGTSGFLWVGGVLASVGFAILPRADARLILVPWLFEPGGVPLIVCGLLGLLRPKPPTLPRAKVVS